LYFKSRCPKCLNPNWHDIHVAFLGADWEEVYLKETVSEEVFAAHVIRGVKDYIKDGIKIKDLCKILVDMYGIAKNFCCDLIQRIKLELCLYSPDRKRLFYAI
jgi:hypothetical protein